MGNAVVVAPVARFAAAVVAEVAAGKAVSVEPVAGAAFPSRNAIFVAEAVVEVAVIPALVAATAAAAGRAAAALFDRCRRQLWQALQPGLPKLKSRA